MAAFSEARIEVFAILTLIATATLAAEERDRSTVERRFVNCDLQPFSNHKLNVDFHVTGNNMKTLPRGKQHFCGVEYSIGEDYIRLAGKRSPECPERVDGIPVNRRVTKLYFLHGGGWGTAMSDGTPVGEYVIHFEDSTSVRVKIVYGQHIRDWWEFNGRPPTVASVAWSGLNHATKDFRGDRLRIQLFQMSWTNVSPQKKVTHFDFVSFNDTICSPFLVAATGELSQDEAQVDDPDPGKQIIAVKHERTVLQDPQSHDMGEDESATLESLRNVGAFLEFDQRGQLVKVSLSGPGPRDGIARGTNQIVALVSSRPTVEFLDVAWSSVTDKSLTSVKTMPNLRSLNLNLTPITDEGLVNLKEMTSLERLWLHNTQVTDDGLVSLSHLLNLRVLDLSNTEVGDAGLRHLEPLTSIQELDLRNTRTTLRGLNALHQALPKARIKR